MNSQYSPTSWGSLCSLPAGSLGNFGSKKSVFLPSTPANEVPSHLSRWFGKLSLNQPACFPPSLWVARILQQSAAPSPLPLLALPLLLFLLFQSPTKEAALCFTMPTVSPVAGPGSSGQQPWHCGPQVGVKPCRIPASGSMQRYGLLQNPQGLTQHVKMMRMTEEAGEHLLLCLYLYICLERMSLVA